MSEPVTPQQQPSPFDNFTDLARRLFAVPKHELHELEEEIAEEKTEEG